MVRKLKKNNFTIVCSKKFTFLKTFSDCTPPHRVTVVTDDTNFAETITPTAESTTVLSQGKL